MYLISSLQKLGVERRFIYKKNVQGPSRMWGIDGVRGLLDSGSN